MAKLSELVDGLLEQEEDRHTVELFGETLPFKISNFGMRKLQSEGRRVFDEEIDPIQAFNRIVASAQANVDIEALQSMTVGDLRTKATEVDVDGYRDMKKAELVSAIAQAQAQTLHLTTDQFLDTLALAYAGLVTFDPTLELEKFEKLFGFQHMSIVMPLIAEDMTQILQDQVDSNEKPVEESDEEGKS